MRPHNFVRSCQRLLLVGLFLEGKEQCVPWIAVARAVRGWLSPMEKTELSRVTQVVNRLLPSSKPDLRRECLTLFANAVENAHSQDVEKWTVTCTSNQLRLIVGKPIVFTIEPQCVCLSLDDDISEDERKVIEQSTSGWRWGSGSPPWSMKSGMILWKIRPS